MSDAPSSAAGRPRLFWVGLAVMVLALGAALAAWYYAGRESTDDAQVDGHVTPIAAKVSGPVAEVLVTDNQLVEAGAVLVRIDPRDFQIALDRARAAYAVAEADARAASSDLPVQTTSTASAVSSAEAVAESAAGGVSVAEREVEAAKARLVASEARQRERDAATTKASRDLERFKTLLAKDEIAHQQVDAAQSASDAAKAASDAAASDVAAARAATESAASRLVQARGAAAEAQANLRTARTAPQQLDIIRARAEAASARVAQAKAALAEAELNVAKTDVKAPTSGIVSKKGVEVGQLIQAGQPLMALVETEAPWVTANFKETQVAEMKPGQMVTIKVDATSGRTFRGKIDSLAAATGSRFSLLPPENATGNYVKVVQRIPVKIVVDPADNADRVLRPGMSVVATVHTR